MYVCICVSTEEHFDGALLEGEAGVLQHNVQILLAIDMLFAHTGQSSPYVLTYVCMNVCMYICMFGV